MDPVTAAAVGGTALDFAGGLIGSSKSSKDAKKNRILQESMAKHGIRWRVDDAKRAGLHPLAALGANISMPNPVMSGSGEIISNAMSNMGQNISRAAQAHVTRDERVQAQAMNTLAIERAGLENELLRTQISSIGRPTTPSLPSATDNPIIPGQGDSFPSAAVDVVPNQLNASEASQPWKEAGAVSDYTFARTKNGYAVVPSKDFKDRSEDMLIPELMWAARNLIRPAMPRGETPGKPPMEWLPRGAKDWKYDWRYSEFRPVY